VAHSTVCDEAASAFRWLATSQGVVVLFAMLVLTARAGLYEMEEEPEVNENKVSALLPSADESLSKKIDTGEEPSNLDDGNVPNNRDDRGEGYG
jgi:hypothetical protein